MSEHNIMVISRTLKVSQNDFRKLRVPTYITYVGICSIYILTCYIILYTCDIDMTTLYNILLLRIPTYRASDRQFRKNITTFTTDAMSIVPRSIIIGRYVYQLLCECYYIPTSAVAVVDHKAKILTPTCSRIWMA